MLKNSSQMRHYLSNLWINIYSKKWIVYWPKNWYSVTIHIDSFQNRPNSWWQTKYCNYLEPTKVLEYFGRNPKILPWLKTLFEALLNFKMLTSGQSRSLTTILLWLREALLQNVFQLLYKGGILQRSIGHGPPWNYCLKKNLPTKQKTNCYWPVWPTLRWHQQRG